MKKAKITMIIPVRNRKKYVETTVRCVADAIRVAAFDVVFVDNGSTDGTGEMLRQAVSPGGLFDGAPVRLLHEPATGACAARNCGLREVSTPYVMFFDSDDLFTPGHMRRIIAAIDSHEGVELLTWDVAMADGQRVPPTPQLPSLRHHLFHASMATQRWCAATELVRRVGGWNESLPVWNDFELGVRLLCAAPKALKIEGAPQVTIIPHPDSITGVRLSDRGAERSTALDAIAATLRNNGAARLTAIVNARRMILAARCRRDGKTTVARRLRAAALADASGAYEKMCLHAVYAIDRLFGRGGSPLAELILLNG